MGTSIFYLIFAQGDVQKFNNPKLMDSPENGEMLDTHSEDVNERNNKKIQNNIQDF